MSIKSFSIGIIILLTANSQSVRAAVGGKQTLDSLRNQLRYKFVLDYLVQSQDTANNYETVDTYSKSVRILSAKDTSVIEEFLFVQHYRLYHWTSFDNKQQYFLLAELSLGFDDIHPQLERFLLLSADTSTAIVLDEYDPVRESSLFAIDTLNGGRIIKIEYPTWGTGYFANHFEIRAVIDGKFKKLFEDYSALLSSPPFSKSPTRLLSRFKFIDLNRDGYIDIQEESTSELVSKDWPQNLFKEGAVESVTSLKQIQKLSKVFIWDKDASVFVEQRLKKL
jgi:hypothetical protein